MNFHKHPSDDEDDLEDWELYERYERKEGVSQLKLAGWIVAIAVLILIFR